MPKNIDAWAEDFNKKVIRWVQTETVLQPLRTTSGRWVLAVLTVAALYGYCWFALLNEGVSAYIYPVLLMVVVLLQKLSLRFIFDDDSIIDELQHSRRNRAYRRAYKRVGTILLTLVAVLSWQSLIRQGLNELGIASSLPSTDALAIHYLDVHQTVVLLTFLGGLFVLQKYLSYGLRGEPRKV